MGRKYGYNAKGPFDEKSSNGRVHLSPEQLLFVEYFHDDVASTYHSMASANHNISLEKCEKFYKNPSVRIAIKARADGSLFVADRKSRQAFWSRVMADETEDMKNRLKASELLGKSEKDFVERIEVTAESDLANAIYEARQRYKAIETTAKKFEDALDE